MIGPRTLIPVYIRFKILYRIRKKDALKRCIQLHIGCEVPHPVTKYHIKLIIMMVLNSEPRVSVHYSMTY